MAAKKKTPKTQRDGRGIGGPIGRGLNSMSKPSIGGKKPSAGGKKPSVAKAAGNRVENRILNRANARQNPLDDDFQSWSRSEGINVARRTEIAARAAGKATTAAVRAAGAGAVVAGVRRGKKKKK